MKKILLILLFVCSSALSVKPQDQSKTQVDIVFCLDLSSSTNGIIERLRDHIWDYVYSLRHCDQRVNFRIGLVGFARPSFGKENQYVKVLSDLTGDFERLNYSMYQLLSKTEKGEQYVSGALKACTEKISWSKAPNAIKVVFLAGNGLVNAEKNDNYTDAVKELIRKGIVLNSIYLLTSYSVKEQAKWEQIARWAGGKYASTKAQFEYAESLHGFDMRKLRGLNERLNDTYLYYGMVGKERWMMQRELDQLVYTNTSEGYAHRLDYRVSEQYLGKNQEWDLIDLYTKNPQAALNADRQVVHDTLKYMTTVDYKAHLVYCKYQRQMLVKQIQYMLQQKEDLRSKNDSVSAKKEMRSFDVITIGWLRGLLEEKGIHCQ